jgi:D-alanine-D-alanine ligase
LRDALSKAGVQVVADADAGLLSRLRADPPSAVFPVIHGAPGEDGSVPEVLELLGAPYVGSLPATLPIAMRAAGMNLGTCGLALLEQAAERAQGA